MFAKWDIVQVNIFLSQKDCCSHYHTCNSLSAHTVVDLIKFPPLQICSYRSPRWPLVGYIWYNALPFTTNSAFLTFEAINGPKFIFNIRIAFVPARKLYQISLLFTNKTPVLVQFRILYRNAPLRSRKIQVHLVLDSLCCGFNHSVNGIQKRSHLLFRIILTPILNLNKCLLTESLNS